MDDVQQIGGTIANALHALGQELTSPRLLLQFALIFIAGVLGMSGAAVVRRRLDLPVLMARWPAFLHKFADLLLANLGTIIFVLVLAFVRTIMLAITWPSASYLVGVAASLASAWVVIALVAGLIRNQFVYRLVAISAWAIAALVAAITSAAASSGTSGRIGLSQCLSWPAGPLPSSSMTTVPSKLSSRAMRCGSSGASAAATSPARLSAISVGNPILWSASADFSGAPLHSTSLHSPSFFLRRARPPMPFWVHPATA